MSTTMKYYTAVSDVDDAANLLPDLQDHLENGVGPSGETQTTTGNPGEE